MDPYYGVADIATGLQVDGKEVATGESQQHVMTPKNTNAPQAGTTYDKITWSFPVAKVQVPAGAALEWTLTGSITAGNNIFLSTSEARGVSFIELPVAAVGAAPVAIPAVSYHVLGAGPAVINRTEAAASSVHHHYNWTNALADPELRLAVQATAGSATFEVRSLGGVVLAKTFAASGNLTDSLDLGKPGAWTVWLNLTGFTGTIALRIGETQLPGGTTTAAASTTSTSGASSAPSTATHAATTTSVGSTAATTSKGTPLGLLPGLAALAAGLALARRRLR